MLFNMLFLFVFGPQVEALCGHLRFLAYYLLCGLAGDAAQIAIGPGSHVPTLGASGAIAGVLGGYLVSFPFASVRTIVPIGCFPLFLRLPALLVIGVWALTQFLNGFGTLGGRAAESQGGTAYFAHIGGFCAGVLLIGLMRSRRGQEHGDGPSTEWSSAYRHGVARSDRGPTQRVGGAEPRAERRKHAHRDRRGGGARDAVRPAAGARQRGRAAGAQAGGRRGGVAGGPAGGRRGARGARDHRAARAVRGAGALRVRARDRHAARAAAVRRRARARRRRSSRSRTAWATRRRSRPRWAARFRW